MLRARNSRSLRLLLLLLAGLVLRLAIVSTWQHPAGDGRQYHRLSQELARAGRFAYEATEPVTYTRLPGYPLYLAFVAVHKAPAGLGEHLIRATRSHVILDLGTALLLYLLLAGFGERTRLAAVLGVLGCPLLWILSTFGLSESLATFLTALMLYLCRRLLVRRRLRDALAIGVVAGLGQLVRADGLTIAPAVLMSVWYAFPTSSQRMTALAGVGLTAALVFAPWPLRNLHRFGALHLAGYEYPAQDGRPLPLGFVRWLRSWSSSAPGEAYVPYLVVNRAPIDTRRHLLPAMWDDPDEHAALVALFEQYNREGLSPVVDRGFEALARNRREQRPWRFYVRLPLGRMRELWRPIPENELPMRVSWLGFPRHRLLWLHATQWVGLSLGLVGAMVLWRRDRSLLGLLLFPVLGRTLLYGFAVPHAVTERYLVEALPALIVLAAVGVARLGRRSETIGTARS